MADVSWEIREGDCVEAMRAMPDASIDAVVCDPPYGLGFMGKEWDDLPPGDEFAAEALRVLKPGGHLLAFGGTRTYHRLACAIEDAGFEIRDSLMWIYGSGFPKSLDVSKAIDKDAGHWRGQAGPATSGNDAMSGPNYERTEKGDPITDDAKAWNGWGTALKPGHEPIVCARKPLTGTVAGNVLAHGTGALNIDGCRVEHGTEIDTERRQRQGADTAGFGSSGFKGNHEQQLYAPGGRFPANVLLDEAAAAELDAQGGGRSQNPAGRFGRDAGGRHRTADLAPQGARDVFGYGDEIGPSRFFYVAKASTAERNAGLVAFPDQETRGNYGVGVQDARPHTPEGYEYRAITKNVHPTVKPIDVMRWLVRLVTPPGGTVLDPFTGSGTTGAAAVLEGFDFIGIEREAEYVEIARARIAWWEQGHGMSSTKAALRVQALKDEAAARRAKIETRQTTLLGEDPAA